MKEIEEYFIHFNNIFNYINEFNLKNKDYKIQFILFLDSNIYTIRILPTKHKYSLVDLTFKKDENTIEVDYYFMNNRTENFFIPLGDDDMKQHLQNLSFDEMIKKIVDEMIGVVNKR